MANMLGPGAFSIIKETAYRLTKNKSLSVKATQMDIELADKKENIEIEEDDNSKPGEVISSTIISLDPLDYQGRWYSISLLDDCVRTQSSSYYWVIVLPLEGTNATALLRIL